MRRKWNIYIDEKRHQAFVEEGMSEEEKLRRRIGPMSKDVLLLLRAVVSGFDYDPGHSDLDDKQPEHVRITLGDYRKAKRLLRQLEGE